jgi:cytochrome c553
MIASLLLAAALCLQGAPEILEQRCVNCHDAKKHKGGLDLSTREGLLRGGDGGAAVVPGKAAESLLYKVVARQQEPFMPQKSERLSDDEVRRIAEWIDAGTPYPRTLVSRAAETPHWAFTPLARAAAGKGIDAFIDDALRAKGLTPAPPADRRTLIRRIHFDLVGLPPTPADLEETDLEALIERLLAGPQYGERWARHWLDAARYADSDGYRYDRDRKNAYPYRDFVIRALNDDLPFDTFVKWQLAGDELAPDDARALAATGFLAAGPVQEKQASDSKRNQERNRYDELDDIVSTLGSSLLGLTIGCARCHDHKFDPIPTRDYYRLVAAFIGTRRDEKDLADSATVRAYQQRLAEFSRTAGPAQAALDGFLDREKAPLFRKKVEALKIRADDREILLLPPDKENQRQQELLTVHQKKLRIDDDELRKQLGAEARAEWERLAKAVQDLEPQRPQPPPRALTTTDAGAKPAKAWLLERGQVELKKEEVVLGGLSALSATAPRARPPAKAKTSFQRAALAEWMTDVDSGAGRLLARVIVNRVWQHHFGEGLVRTPNDFGAQGEAPTHPELLDWLATELIARGWRLKELHRLILRSAAYRRGTRFSEDSARVDADHRLLWRRRPLRLEAEALRDAILSVSGRLNPEMYGPGVKAPIPADLIITRTEGENQYPKDVPDGPAVWRRSVYLFIKRSVPFPLTEVFDTPSPSASCGKRIRTTVAPQALLLMNDAFVRARAADFAARVAPEADPVGRAYLLALGREPQVDERASARDFVAKHGLPNFCHVLFMMNEFLYVD